MPRLAHLIDEYNRTKRQAGEPVMTQGRLAQLVGVSRVTVSNHARGRSEPLVTTVLAYARVLGVTVEELVSDAAA